MIMESLQLLNRVVGNIALILTFSLWAYLTIRSWGAPVARALMIMLFGVFTAVAADVLVRDARDPRIVEDILRWCWIGIVLVPTSMLHMVLALALQLQTGRNYRWLIIATYMMGAIIVLLVVVTDAVVSMPIRISVGPALTPQPLFGWVAVYAFSLVTVCVRWF
jgi:hypothetical protein